MWWAAISTDLNTASAEQTRNYIARLDATTGVADSFNPNANDSAMSVAMQADGKILAAGQFTSIGGANTQSHGPAQCPTTGLADSFDPNANDIVFAITVQPDGKILAGGTFFTIAPNGGSTVTRNNMARLETDGRLDRTLNLDAIGSSYLPPPPNRTARL